MDGTGPQDSLAKRLRCGGEPPEGRAQGDCEKQKLGTEGPSDRDSGLSSRDLVGPRVWHIGKQEA